MRIDVSSLSAYVPLGLLGLVRWASWLIRRVPASLYRPARTGHFEPLTIVVPVYQEDRRVFRQALESWLANRVEEVICVIDRTDTACLRIAAEYPVRVIPTDVPGKRDALRRGWEAARTPLVALVDSDTIWARDVADRVCEPFADRRVGGVGTRQNVAAPRTVWEHLNDMYLDYRYFDEIASQTVVGRAVSCLSGRTAVYRRELLLRHSRRFMDETFLGVPCMSGDDKRLTTLVLEGGHLTVLQRSARVWSTFPRDGRTFFRQRLRWSRNTWRSDLRALGSRWVWSHKFLAFSMLDKAASSFTLLAAPTFMVLAVAAHHWRVVGLLALWWLISRSAKLLPHLERRPAHAVTMVPVFIVMSFAMALVKIAALLTIRKQRWLTRDVEVSATTKRVVRTVAASVVVVLLASGAGLLVARPAAAIPRRITHLEPDAVDILRSPRKFQRSSRRQVVVRPDRLDLMQGPAVLERLPFAGRGRSSLADVVAALDTGRHAGWIQETAPGVFLLRVPLVQAPGTVLAFAAPAVRQVRLLDGPEMYLSAMGATARFDGVTVTSWDPRRGGPARDATRPRPFVEYAEGSDLRIVRSTFAYLGSDRSSAYGVNWRRSTGLATDSSFHHNFFGAYTYQAHDVVFRGNVFRDNAVYGLDPHTGSTRLVVEDNRAFRNRVHGIVFSQDVTDGVVRGNRSYANGSNGIVIDERSNRNTVSGNLVEGNRRDGIVLLGSSGNLVSSNIVRGNRVGIRVNLRSGGNRVQHNEVSDNRTGVELYGGAYDVRLLGNQVSDSALEGLVLEAPGTTSRDDHVSGSPVGVEVRAPARLRGTTVERVGLGIVVTERGIAAVDDATVRATTSGLDIRQGALVRLRTSSIRSPSPLSGSPPRAVLANRLVAPAGPVRWLAVIGVAYLVVAVLLQVVHKRRNRVGRSVREVPQGVAKW
jgi:parallel beta-helix repeat protein